MICFWLTHLYGEVERMPFSVMRGSGGKIFCVAAHAVRCAAVPTLDGRSRAFS